VRLSLNSNVNFALTQMAAKDEKQTVLVDVKIGMERFF
jgi:hypothetical protein